VRYTNDAILTQCGLIIRRADEAVHDGAGVPGQELGEEVTAEKARRAGEKLQTRSEKKNTKKKFRHTPIRHHAEAITNHVPRP
jgi:hypothetical protein